MAPAEPLTLFDPEPPTTPAPPNRLLQVRRIYAEAAAADSPRGRQVLGRFPDAELVEVPSHWRIPELHGNEGTRIRFSVMPEDDAQLLDVRTSRVAERIAAVDDFVEAGYEVHLNLSPVVLREGWEGAWAALLQRLDDELSPAAKAQAAAEVILLTHNRDLHEVNLGWHPKAEELLWRPELQQPKRSQNGQDNVRYRNDVKRDGVQRLQRLIDRRAPWLRVRYAF
jgi:DNA repair photolyase